MQPAEFFSYHAPALEVHEARHNLILAILARAARESVQDVVTWSLGAPGQCAAMSLGWQIVLGELDTARCRELADITADVAYPGVIGPDRTAQCSSSARTRSASRFSIPCAITFKF